MPRKIRDAKLESRSARLRLPIRKKPYSGPALARGIHLLYRRNKGNGTWVVKCSNAHGGYWTARFGQADDFEDSDGTHILTFHQAGEAAKQLARGTTDASDSKPMTVADGVALRQSSSAESPSRRLQSSPASQSPLPCPTKSLLAAARHSGSHPTPAPS